MADTTGDSDAILAGARTTLAQQRAGGRRQPPIGRASADLRRRHVLRKGRNIAIAGAAVLLLALVAGLVLDGIGLVGVMVTALALVAVAFIFGRFPALAVPQRADINTGSVAALVGKTELWLEAQRPALPAPAVQLVDRIGVQLDALGLQLDTVDPANPAAAETRRLVGEHLPETIEAYRRIPATMRREARAGAGATPDAQLAEALGRISHEIDAVTRQMADGALDDLAVRTRYLDYRYGTGPEADDGAVAVPQLHASRRADGETG